MKTDTILSEAFGQDAAHLASEEKRLLLSRLLARLAHEVRNPLSSMDIHVQLLQEDLAKLAPQIRERTTGRLDIIRGELSRLESIVGNFLGLTGPESLALEPVEIQKICAHVGRLVQPEAESHRIQLELQMGKEMPVISADAGQLTQALLNLVINALQAVEADGHVEVRAHHRTKEFIVVEVADSGPGVSDENRKTIFDPFFTTKKNGTGLGLWIAQQIVLAHNGTIQVANGPKGGAVFTMQLPLAQKSFRNE